MAKYSAAIFIGICLLSGLAAGYKINTAHAGFFSDVTKFFSGSSDHVTDSVLTSQQMPILQAPLNSGVKVLGTTTRLSDAPVISFDNQDLQPSSTIPATYTVVSGDNPTKIAQKLKVSLSDLLAANNLTAKSTIKPKQKLIIPAQNPSGSQVKDSVSTSPAASLIPPPPIPKTPVSAVKTPLIETSPDGYFIRPIAAGENTQGIHGHNAVDLADACGTPIYASAAGTTTIADTSGWNGGYGEYVEIDHSNGSQTLYAHLQTVIVSVDQVVTQGQQIGTMGKTGDATGCHVHFEIHNNGYANPFLS